MGIVLAMSIFFVIVTMVFVTIALLLPEWMGITGKKAKKIMESQREEKPAETTSVPSPATPSEAHSDSAKTDKH